MMNDPIHLTDKHFNPENTGNCHLLIHLAEQSYSYAIIDKEEDRPGILVKKRFSEHARSLSAGERLEILLAENAYLKHRFRKVKVSIETKSFTFIPKDLYSGDDLAQYSKFIGSPPEARVLSSAISFYGIVNVCGIDADLADQLQTQFHEPLVLSQVNPFMAGISKLISNGRPAGLFLNFNAGNFEAAVIKDGTLEFYNIFEIASADEFNYFLLNLISQFDTDRSMPVTLSGEVQEEDEYFKRLIKYFDNISFTDSGMTGGGSELFDRIPPHVFFSLLSLDLCE